MNLGLIATKAILRASIHAASILTSPSPSTGLVVFRDADDLLFCVSLALDLRTSQPSKYAEIPHRAWYEIRVKGPCQRRVLMRYQ